LSYEASDPDGSRRMCATSPVFVFDPDDASNRPSPGNHDAVLNFWPIYPQSLRDLFTRGFTKGLRDPEARIMDNDWRKELSRLKDAIFPCPQCGAENFFDVDCLKSAGHLKPCWSCGHVPKLPPRMRFGGIRDSAFVMLNPGTQLFAHHLNGDDYNFLTPLAEVVADPLGLKNLSSFAWTSRVGDQPLAAILPGTTLQLQSACKIHFGRTEADVRL
jgi:hypothetical protein